MSSAPKTPKISNKTVFILLGVVACVMFFCLLTVVLVAAVNWAGSGSAARPVGKIKAIQTFPGGDDSGELEPDVVVDAFLTELSREQFEDAYKFRTAVSFQGQMSQAEFKQLVEKHRGIIRHISRKMSRSQRQAGIYEYKIRLGGSPFGPAECTLEVSQENEGWRIRRFTAETPGA